MMSLPTLAAGGYGLALATDAGGGCLKDCSGEGLRRAQSLGERGGSHGGLSPAPAGSKCVSI